MCQLLIRYIKNLHPPTEIYYPMDSQPKGHVLIINIKYFDNDPNATRNGTEEDARRLLQVFSDLNFLVEEKKDLTAEVVT